MSVGAGGGGATASSAGPRLPPGSEGPRRFRPRLRYELVGCALHGHELLGTDARRLRAEDRIFAQQESGFRWYRCLRCDAWLPLPDPSQPSADVPPPRSEVELPLRGRPLRDRYVLRVIAVERGFHALILTALTVAVWVFAAHRQELHHEYTRVLTDLQGGLGGPVVSARSGVVNDLNRLFALPSWELYVIAIGLSVYTALLIAEVVGLWRARRWAEYLTFFEAAVLVPYELYEIARGVTWLKVLTLAINLAILLYLLIAHRLFGLRGGTRAQREMYARDTGWPALEAATLPQILDPARLARHHASSPSPS